MLEGRSIVLGLKWRCPENRAGVSEEMDLIARHQQKLGRKPEFAIDQRQGMPRSRYYGPGCPVAIRVGRDRAKSRVDRPVRSKQRSVHVRFAPQAVIRSGHAFKPLSWSCAALAMVFSALAESGLPAIWLRRSRAPKVVISLLRRRRFFRPRYRRKFGHRQPRVR